MGEEREREGKGKGGEREREGEKGEKREREGEKGEKREGKRGRRGRGREKGRERERRGRGKKFVSKNSNFLSFEQNRQIHLIKRCQFIIIIFLNPYNTIKDYSLVFKNKNADIFFYFRYKLLNIDSILKCDIKVIEDSLIQEIFRLIMYIHCIMNEFCIAMFFKDFCMHHISSFMCLFL